MLCWSHNNQPSLFHFTPFLLWSKLASGYKFPPPPPPRLIIFTDTVWVWPHLPPFLLTEPHGEAPVTARERARDKTQHVGMASLSVVFMHNSPLFFRFCLSVNTLSSEFFVQQILWRTPPLGASAFKVLPLSFSPSVCLLLFPVNLFNAKPTHVQRENKTSNFTSPPFKALGSEEMQGCLCVSVRARIFFFFRVFELPLFWLQTGSVGTGILQRSLKSGTGLLRSAAVDANTHLNTCSGNTIKGSDVCEARQPQAQNWFTELEKSRSRGIEERGKRKQVRFRAFEATEEDSEWEDDRL